LNEGRLGGDVIFSRGGCRGFGGKRVPAHAQDAAGVNVDVGGRQNIVSTNLNAIGDNLDFEMPRTYGVRLKYAY